MRLPDSVFEDLAWTFKGGVAPFQKQFCDKVRDYQRRIANNDSWNESAIVLPVTRVKISYRRSEDQRVVELTADSDAGFPAGELLYKLHNAVVEALEDRDHRYFEGLRLKSLPIANEPAIYMMRLGS